MDFGKYIEDFISLAKSRGYGDQDIKTLLSYAQPLFLKHLPIIYDQYHLSLLLGYNYFFLLAITNSKHTFYKHYEIPKHNGGIRQIEEPFPALKEIQNWILKNILEPASHTFVSSVAKAFIPGKTIKENARFHKKQNIVVALDIKDFFGSIRFEYIYSLFIRFGYNKPVSVLLAHLCTYKGVLPQGAPTSPMLSNLFIYDVDKKIFNYCLKRKIRYTRYADDLTFSSDKINVNHLIAYVNNNIKPLSLTLNNDKIKIMGRGMSQQVTGVVVNEIMQVPRTIRRKIRQEIYYSIKYGIKDHMKHASIPSWIVTTQQYINHLSGKVQYVLQINPKDKEFIRYSLWLRDIQKVI